MKLTINECKKLGGCGSAIEYYSKQTERDLIKVLEMSMQKKHIDAVKKEYDEDILSWSIWIIPRKLKNKRDIVRFAIFCAEQVLPIFESEYPKDNRPRKAIEAAKKWLKFRSRDFAAAWAAYADAVDAADATDAAAWAAYAVAYAASYVAWTIVATNVCAGAIEAAVWAADAAACDAVWSAAGTAAAARIKMQKKIIRYGIKLLKGEKQCQ